jgi:hypothetical protein
MIARIKCGKYEGYVDAEHDDVWQHIKTNYRNWKKDQALSLLYLTKRFVPGETSLIVKAENADAFMDFLNQHILPLECVSGSHIFNLMKPTFLHIPKGTCLDLKRFTVTINADPVHYQEIYDSICKIEPTKYFVVNYVAFTFQDHGDDILVSVLAKGLSAAKKGVLDHIESQEGVLNTNITRITKTRKLYSYSDLLKFHGKPFEAEDALSMDMF